jgi:hypothetical protein
MSPHFPELVDSFHRAGHTISVTTNGSRNPDYWQRMAPMIDWIGFSYHPEFVNERFFDNLNRAAELTRTGARVMMLSSHWDQCLEVFERLQQSDRYQTTPVRVVEWGRNNGTDRYTPEQLAWFEQVKIASPDPKHLSGRRHPDLNSSVVYDDGRIDRRPHLIELINQGLTNFKDYECLIGLRSLFIGWQGKIKRGNCMAGGHIGDINDPDDIQWPEGPITCPYTLCHCTSDVGINKRRIPIYIK